MAAVEQGDGPQGAAADDLTPAAGEQEHPFGLPVGREIRGVYGTCRRADSRPHLGSIALDDVDGPGIGDRVDQLEDDRRTLRPDLLAHHGPRSTPPSTARHVPVTYDAAGESRKAATAANSAGSP